MLLGLLISFASTATVILQYHHVSDSTPPSTSISPAQFEKHLQYLHDQEFTVLPLLQVVDAIKNSKKLPDKSVVITFDDAYTNNVEYAKPLLDKFNYPYTIFVNPRAVQSKSSLYLSWQQLVDLSQGSSNEVTIANHGFTHDSFIRTPENMNDDEWFKQQTDNLLLTESLITKHTGQSWKYFAYPYGEYSAKTQQWLADNDFIGFGQQSGAIGVGSDLTLLPRFPASMPYDKLENLKDKLYSLPLNLTPVSTDVYDANNTVFKHGDLTEVNFDVTVKDFYRGALTCYVSGQGKHELNWINRTQFSIKFNNPLVVGRARVNCTAASISKPGRFYWFSQTWFITNTDGSWFPLD